MTRAGPLFAAITAMTLYALTASAGEMPRLAGTWNVTATESHGTCTDTPGKVHAYVWIVSTDPQGMLVIEVQGTTSFPALIGIWNTESDQLTIHGLYKDDSRPDTSWFQLQIQGDQLIGVRRYLGVRTDETSGRSFVCFSDYLVVATR